MQLVKLNYFDAAHEGNDQQTYLAPDWPASGDKCWCVVDAGSFTKPYKHKMLTVSKVRSALVIQTGSTAEDGTRFENHTGFAIVTLQETEIWIEANLISYYFRRAKT